MDATTPGALERRRTLLRTGCHLVVATTDDSGPWAATLAYVAGTEGRVYFRSPLAARHVVAVNRDPHVAVVLYDDSGSRVDSLQCAGTARRLEDKNSNEADWLLTRIAARDGLVRPSPQDVADWLVHPLRGLFRINVTEAYVQDFTSWDTERIDRRLAVPVAELFSDSVT
jgi:nitroimidazol reductase NimA-like FMN-containing flavoprotein (pyridoxamine 5'-phosphate oxidase superfamily)